MDQLRRETQPPAGTPPSPVPQYWNPDADQYERVQGAHGAPRAILYGPNGQPISSANRLPVEATGVYPEYRLLSTDQKPDAAEVGVGAVVYEVDTQTVYMSDGKNWVVQ